MKKIQINKEPTAIEVAPRRKFLNLLWGILAAISCLELSWFTGSILKSRRKRTSEEQIRHIVEAGVIDQFEQGSVKAIPEGQFYLSRLEDGSFLALSKTCTHLGCAIPWDSTRQLFVCPCHGSTFDRTGMVMSPPATRPLDYFPIRIENEKIRVDISIARRRDSFKPSQAVRV
jgi:cytochrome b6-f complex iron-sulfur subunit